MLKAFRFRLYPDKAQAEALSHHLGLSRLAVVLDGSIIANPRHIRGYERKIAVLGRCPSRKKKGSRNRFKAKLKLAGVYERLGDARRDTLHKTSRSLVNRYSLISLENLNIAGMFRNGLRSRLTMLDGERWRICFATKLRVLVAKSYS
jgi:transposase